MQLALVQKLVLVCAPKSRKPQLTLRVMGQKLATEHNNRRIDKDSANAESQSVQDVRQIIGGGIGGQPATRDTGLNRPPDLLGVQSSIVTSAISYSQRCRECVRSRRILW
jgi:hypothetical protein